MNQPRTVELPPIKYPVVTIVISDPIFPIPAPVDAQGRPLLDQMTGQPLPAQANAEPIFWKVNGAHPFAAGMRIVRMFILDDSIEIYSVSPNEQPRQGDPPPMRDTIPRSHVRLAQETMPADIFVEEITLAQEEEEEDDDEPSDEPDPEDDRQTPVPPAPAPSVEN